MYFAPALIRRNAFAAPRAFDRTFERFLDSAFTAAPRQSVQFKQDDTTYTLTLDLPGIDKSQLAIDIEGAQVRIETTEGAARGFKGAYELPQELDGAASTARLENGVLTLTLGKKAPVNNAVRVAIN